MIENLAALTFQKLVAVGCMCALLHVCVCVCVCLRANWVALIWSTRNLNNIIIFLVDRVCARFYFK
jgi:hypothetical protein